MDYKQLASDIVRLVGTESNIKSVTHCMTRLRFILNDVSKADKEALQNLKGVLGVVYNGGQYMVILGQNLLPVYESVVKDHNIAAEAPAAVEEKKDEEITAVTDGRMIPIEDVKDEAFASKAMGDGVAFEPTSDYICAPANGEIAMIFHTGHAFGMTSDYGQEFLVHIGIDTVALNGEGFQPLVNQGDKVKAGQPIVKVNRALVEGKGYDLTTMLIITDDNGKEIKFKNITNVERGMTINE